MTHANLSADVVDCRCTAVHRKDVMSAMSPFEAEIAQSPAQIEPIAGEMVQRQLLERVDREFASRYRRRGCSSKKSLD